MKRLAAALTLLAAWLPGRAAAAVPSPAELLQITAVLAPSAEPGKGVLKVTASLAEGWHVNSHTPSEDYLIPTAVALDAAGGVSAGQARYPEGQAVKFSFSDKPLSVYQKTFAIEVPVTWQGGPPEALSGKIDFQACNDKQCLAPASLPFRATLSAEPTPSTRPGTPRHSM